MNGGFARKIVLSKTDYCEDLCPGCQAEKHRLLQFNMQALNVRPVCKRKIWEAGHLFWLDLRMRVIMVAAVSLSGSVSASRQMIGFVPV